MTSTPTVHTEGLAFRYPDGHVALRGVDLRVDAGERVALLGPNGAGKTTFALHLNGIHRATQGSVEIDGLPLTDENLPEVRRRVGLVFQDPDDQLFMSTVREDVGFGPANLGLSRDEVRHRTEEALDAVGMLDLIDRAPHHLSGGEKRRVALATVLSMRPSVLVLDEPTSNLDPASRRELIEVLSGLELTVLTITHDLPYALEACERSVIFDGGRIVADGPTNRILADDELLRAHRLELPYAFDPAALGLRS